MTGWGISEHAWAINWESTNSLDGPGTDDFALNKTCESTLAAGTSCTLSITFSPVSNGGKSASINIADNAGDSPQTVSLSGTGITTSVPSLSLSATSLAFGNQKAKTTSVAKTVTVKNVGSASVSVQSIKLTGGQADECRLAPRLRQSHHRRRGRLTPQAISLAGAGA